MLQVRLSLETKRKAVGAVGTARRRARDGASSAAARAVGTRRARDGAPLMASLSASDCARDGAPKFDERRVAVAVATVHG